MLFATSIGSIIHCTPQRSLIGLVIIFSFLLFINNLTFAFAKTYTVMANDHKQSETRLKIFVQENGILPNTKVILPPNMWFLATKQNLTWRVSYLTLIGQKESTYNAYLLDNLTWNPEFIVLDQEDWPERSYKNSTLQTVDLSKANLSQRYSNIDQNTQAGDSLFIKNLMAIHHKEQLI